MFLILDKSLAKYNATTKKKVELLLKNLETCDRERYHYITIDRKTYDKLKDKDLLSDVKEFLKISSNRYLQNDVMTSDLNIVCYICLIKIADEKVIKRNSKTTLLLSYERFLKLKMSRETLFILESDNDFEVYKYIVDYYIHNKSIPVTYVFDDDNGGGHNIAKRFNRKQKENRFCLCICEADKKYPTALPGKTAKDLMTVQVSNLSSYYDILQINEVENLIPLHVLKNCAKYKNHSATTWVEKLEKNYPEARFYFDFKKGFKNRILKNNLAMVYWSPIFNQLNIDIAKQLLKCCKDHKKNVDSCSVEFIKGFGNDLLSDMQNINDSTNLTNYHLPELKKKYLEIGKTIFSWTCCPNLEVL
jgi:hypothetical protein